MNKQISNISINPLGFNIVDGKCAIPFINDELHSNVFDKNKVPVSLSPVLIGGLSNRINPILKNLFIELGNHGIFAPNYTYTNLEYLDGSDDFNNNQVIIEHPDSHIESQLYDFYVDNENNNLLTIFINKIIYILMNRYLEYGNNVNSPELIYPELIVFPQGKSRKDIMDIHNIYKPLDCHLFIGNFITGSQSNCHNLSTIDFLEVKKTELSFIKTMEMINDYKEINNNSKSQNSLTKDIIDLIINRNNFYLEDLEYINHILHLVYNTYQLVDNKTKITNKKFEKIYIGLVTKAAVKILLESTQNMKFQIHIDKW